MLASAGNTSMCLTVSGSSVVLAACNGSAAQNVVSTTYGQQTINGLCLDQQPDPTYAGGRSLVLAMCNGGKSQKWGTDGGQLKNELGWCVDNTSLRTAKCPAGFGWTRNANTGSGPTPSYVATVAPNGSITYRTYNVNVSQINLSAAALQAMKTSAAVIIDNHGALVAAGGGNLQPGSGQWKLVAAGGGNLVAAGGGNLVAAGGGNIADLMKH